MTPVESMPATAGESECQRCYRLAKSLIPGGTQLLSKRPEMFAPDQWPGYYREARGSVGDHPQDAEDRCAGPRGGDRKAAS